jgi:hypothetical protein
LIYNDASEGSEQTGDAAMMTTLTAQDVSDADFARNTRRLAASESTTPDAILREFAYDATQLAEDRARFARGEELLKDYIVLVSDRSVIGGEFDAKTAARIVSPIVQMQSGHIATSTAYRAVALAQR